MRKLFTISALLSGIMIGGGLQAQSFYTGMDYGVSAGASQYFGDLNDSYGFKFIRPAVGGFIRDQLNPYISVKATLNFTEVGYNDSYNSNPYEKERNLNFRSDIAEFAAQADFNFFKFITGDVYHRCTPYLTGGFGVFYYNPYTLYDGTKYYLRPIGTEGQLVGYSGRKYGDFSVCFPLGVGVKYWLMPGVNLGAEIADRLTLTDYLDDVSNTYVGADKFPSNPAHPNPDYILQNRSIEVNPNSTLGEAGKQRGNNATKDQYAMFLFSISLQFKTYRCPNYMKSDLN